MDVQTYVKWGIVGGIAFFGMYLFYSFALSQGWIQQGGGMVARRRARFKGERGFRLFKSQAEMVEKPTILGTLPTKGYK